MIHKTEITWKEGVKISKQEQEKQAKQQAEKLDEFLTSSCDLFSFADWEYYAEVTGEDVDWLRMNAKYDHKQGAYGTMLENAIIDRDTNLAEFFI